MHSDGFVKAGCVHDLRLHQFKTGDTVNFVVMAMVKKL